MDLKMLIFFVGIFLVVSAYKFDSNMEESEEEEEEDDKEYRKTFFPRNRRPLDLNIRVPFFQMALRRKEPNGPAKLGLKVFPEFENGGLVNINHRWWWKK